MSEFIYSLYSHKENDCPWGSHRLFKVEKTRFSPQILPLARISDVRCFPFHSKQVFTRERLVLFDKVSYTVF